MYPQPKLLALVERRHAAVREFLTWAIQREAAGRSLRLAARPDLKEAAKALEAYAEGWWGLVVFTCFDTAEAATAVARFMPRPVRPELTRSILDRIPDRDLPIGPHRAKGRVEGARRALVSACQCGEAFHAILRTNSTFDQRYRLLRNLPTTQWGHLACFDLLVRAGHLGVYGHRYAPEHAYLAESDRPKRGFEALWGVRVGPANAAESEELLKQWTRSWALVSDAVGVEWPGAPYTPADIGNALGSFQQRRGGREQPPRSVRAG